MTRTVNALILGGGAIRGAFQVGVTEYLMNQQNLRFDVICGISSGGLNATMLSQ
ncbi:MAG TPA: Patatin, partial [Myxococcales bacterium]|nr:Patatin [Myxococcales bacterium]